MRPVEEAVREAGIAALIGMGCTVHKISGGKAPKHLFLRNVPHEHIGSRLKVLKQTEDSSFIAKVDENGNIVGEPSFGSHDLAEWTSIVENALANLDQGA